MTRLRAALDRKRQSVVSFGRAAARPGRLQVRDHYHRALIHFCPFQTIVGQVIFTGSAGAMLIAGVRRSPECMRFSGQTSFLAAR